MAYLISIAIGPVQDFINTARRSRDLWFGSWLLSELSKAAALAIIRHSPQNEMIFPEADKNKLQPGTDFSVVNKIVASVSDPNTLVPKIREALRTRLDKIRSDAYREIKGDLAWIDEDRAKKQVEDLIEFFWAAAECSDPNDSEQYNRARRQSETLLAARKATRDFRPTAIWNADHSPKSSLDGQRESVIGEKRYEVLQERGIVEEERRRREEVLRREFGVRRGERLCGVGLLKRHGNRYRRGISDANFFSTSHIAALPLLSRFHSDDAAVVASRKEQVNKYIKRLIDEAGLNPDNLNRVPLPPSGETYPKAFQRYDGHFLFEERLREYFPEKAQFDKARKILNDFLENAFDGEKPNPYYALLLADGDRMGQAIEAQQNLQAHKDLSSSLSAFAGQVAEIVEDEFHGSLVYAGGDDVLAFLPLHTALACAHRLSAEFHQQLTEFLFKDDDGKKLSPTLSVGLVVAHHLDPLSDALNLVRAAEKEAKNVLGKNALAITVSKRSGADVTVKGHWGDFDRRLNWFVTLHCDNALPDGAAYELRDLSIRLKSKKTEGNHQTLQEAMRCEAVRILHRKRSQQGLTEVSKKVLDQLKSYIESGTRQPDADVISIEELAKELIVARVFADASRQASKEAQKNDATTDLVN